ncbi:MAG: hypothetical protein M3O15_03195 [Acidobacteriota bacterium]|nr:hypothetical protein [Acidobacteriota bacterium]
MQKHIKKLTLTRDTLRELSRQEATMAGASPITNWASCFCPTSPLASC